MAAETKEATNILENLPQDIDECVDIVADKVREVMDGIEPHWTIQNDSFDHAFGTEHLPDYIEVEGNEDDKEATFILKGVDKNFADELCESLDTCRSIVKEIGTEFDPDFAVTNSRYRKNYRDLRADIHIHMYTEITEVGSDKVDININLIWCNCDD